MLQRLQGRQLRNLSSRPYHTYLPSGQRAYGVLWCRFHSDTFCYLSAVTPKGLPWSCNRAQRLEPIWSARKWALRSAEPLVIVVVLSRDAFLFTEGHSHAHHMTIFVQIWLWEGVGVSWVSCIETHQTFYVYASHRTFRLRPHFFTRSVSYTRPSETTKVKFGSTLDLDWPPCRIFALHTSDRLKQKCACNLDRLGENTTFNS